MGAGQGVSGDAPRLAAKGLYRRLLQVFETGEPVDFSVGAPMAWIKAIDELLIDGHTEAARAGLARLRDAEPDLQWSESVLELIDLLPKSAEQGPRFIDNRELDVQVVNRQGSKTVIFAFCGRKHRLGMPLWLTQRWMSQFDASIVYLRDFRDLHYLGGVRSWDSRDRTLISLNWIAEQLKAERVLCMGNSSGGYAALDYGLALGAEAVLSFSGGTNLEPEFNTFLNRADGAAAIREAFPNAPLNLRDLYLAAPRRPRSILVYGDQCWDDRLHSENMRGVPDVRLWPLKGFIGHGSLPELIRRGGFDATMGDFLAIAPQTQGAI